MSDTLPELEGRYARALGDYLGGAGVSARERLRTINLISDLTTGEFGGYQAVLAIHAEGSLEAEKLALLRSYDSKPALDFVRQLASFSGP